MSKNKAELMYDRVNNIDLNLLGEFSTLSELFEALNEELDLDYTYDMWRGYRRRSNNFRELVDSMIDDSVPEMEGTDKVKPIDLPSLVQKIEAAYQKRHIEAQHNNIVDLNTDKPIAIVGTGDWHVSSHCNYPRLLAEMQTIANTPNMYIMNNGDLGDTFVDGWAINLVNREDLSIQEQIALIQHILKITAPKTLGLCLGNHDEWISVLDYHPYVEYLRQIGYDGFVGRNRLDVQLNVHGNSHHIRMQHNWSGSSYHNASYAMERTFLRGETFDIAIKGHTHEAGVYREFVDPRENKTSVALICGAYKNETDNYAYRLGLTPSNNSTSIACVIHPEYGYLGISNVFAASQYLKSFFNQ